MSAPTGSAPVSPFLAFVSPQDRSPMRVGLWLALGLPLAFFGMVFAELAALALSPGLLDRLAAAPGAPAGPHPLLTAGRLLGLFGLTELAMAVPLLGAAQLAFQRPAWTFASPARPFAPKLLLWGALIYGVLFTASIGVEVLTGTRLAPPLLDVHQPVADRIVYALASAPLVLLAIAAQELVFRGVLLQVAGAFIRTRIGLCVVDGLAFALVRTLLDDPASPVVLLELMLAGMAFAYAVLELGGLEFSLGARFSATLILVMLETPSATTGAAAPFHWTDLAKAETWISLATTAAVSLATAGAVRLIKRRRTN